MRRLIKTALIAVVLIFTTLIYLGHFHNGFHFDDAHTILENPHITRLSNIPSFFVEGSETFSTLPQNQMYRPLVTSTLAIDYALSKTFDPDSNGFNPLYYHIDSFFWFLMVIVLIILLAYQILQVQYHGLIKSLGFITSIWWGGLFFGIHTAVGETVNYIIARSDIISAAGILGGLYVYIKCRKTRKYGLYLIPVLLGMTAKEVAAMFYPILLTYIILIEKGLSYPTFFRHLFRRTEYGKLSRNAILDSLPALVVILAFGLFSIVGMRGEDFTPSQYSSYTYAITQPWVIQHYFQSFFFPVHLSADSDWTPLADMTDARFISGAFFLLLFILTTFIISKRSELRIVSFGMGFFLLALLPTSSFVALAEVTNDHRMFLPFIGLTLAVVGLATWALHSIQMHSRRRLISGLLFNATIIIFIFHILGTMNRINVWHDDESLWADVVEKSPNNARGLMNYGLTLMSQARYDEAMELFQKALVLNPYYPYLHTNLGILYEVNGNVAMSEKHFGLALQYGPNQHEVHYFYAKFLKNQKRYSEALNHLNTSIQLSPAYLPARYLLMQTYLELEAWQKVRQLANETLAMFPGNQLAQQYLDLAGKKPSKLELIEAELKKGVTPELLLDKSLMQYYLGDFEGCIASCREALRLKPDYAEAYNNICSAYNMLSEWQKAMDACAEAMRLQPGYTLAENNYRYAQSQLE